MNTSIPQKRCSKCNQFKPATTEFFNATTARYKYGVINICRECSAKMPNKPGYVKPPVIEEGMRQCGKCKGIFPATTEYFHSDKGRKYGVAHMCKKCRGIIRHDTWFAKHPVKVIPDGYKECNSCKQLKPATKECFCANKRTYDGLRPQCKICDAKYREAHVKEKSLNWAAYYASNAERIKQQALGDIERNRTRHRNRKAREKAVPGTHTPQEIRQQYDRQKHKCYYCRSKVKRGEHHVDHTFPVSREGASNDISYLVITCKPCNLKKGS